MIPAIFMYLKEMPLNQNGKLNRLNLPKPTEKNLDKSKYVEPKTKIEKELVKIWQEVLNVKKIGLNDDFFNLGGHSLVIVKVLAKINKKFKIDLPFGFIFENPVLIEQSYLIKEIIIQESGIYQVIN